MWIALPFQAETWLGMVWRWKIRVKGWVNDRNERKPRKVKPYKGEHICPTRTRIYAFNFPKNVFNPSQKVRFLLIFNGFECEGLDFQPFTSGRSWVTIRERRMNGGWYIGESYVNLGRSEPSHGKPPVNKGHSLQKCFSRREHLKIQTFTLEAHGKSAENLHFVKEWTLFSEKTRIRERAKRGEKSRWRTTQCHDKPENDRD